MAPSHHGVTTEHLDGVTSPDGILLDLESRAVWSSSGSPGRSNTTDAPPANAYSQRLVISRVLYDQGTLLAHSPSSAGLAGASEVLLCPSEAAPLGVGEGTRVKVTSQHGTLTLPARADDSVPKGVAVIHHNLSGGDPGALVHFGDQVCDVRVEVA